MLDVEYSADVDRDAVAINVAMRCDTWPHHMTSWMRSACIVLPDCNFVVSRESTDKINERCDEIRAQYYERRLARSRFLNSPTRRQAFGSLVQNGRSVGIETIEETMSPLFSRSTVRFEISTFLADALRSGLLMQRPGFTYQVPIPNLAKYLLEFGGLEEQTEKNS